MFSTLYIETGQSCNCDWEEWVPPGGRGKSGRMGWGMGPNGIAVASPAERNTDDASPVKCTEIAHHTLI